MMMKIVLNNREEIIKDRTEISVEELITYKNFTFPMIIFKINGELVKKEHYSVSLIKNGDNVTALHLISGG